MARPTMKIFYGPPGTGKTYRAAREAVRVIDGSFPTEPQAFQARHEELAASGRIVWVTFHPSYSYEDFVEGYRPVTTESGSISYQVEEGPFRRACRTASGRPSGKELFASGLVVTEGTGSYQIERTEGGVVFVRRIGNAGLEARRPIALTTVLSIVGKIRSGELSLEDLKYPKGAETAKEAKAKVSSATDVASYYLSDETPIRALVRRVLGKEVSPGEVLADAKGVGRYEVVRVDEGGWLLRSKPGRADEVAETQARWVPRFVIERFMGLGLDPGVFKIAGKSLYDPSEFGLTDKELPEPTEHEKKAGKRQGSTLRKAIAGRHGLSSTDFSNVGQYGAVYRRVIGAGNPGVGIPVVLVIDEINRADLSRVFGELITLIEADKREGAAEERSVILPYSRDRFAVPGNLSVIATMNTADRSLSVFDLALRRRFEFEEVAPEPGQCPEEYGGVDVRGMLARWNRRIAALHSREVQLGHSELMQHRLEEVREAHGWPAGPDGELRALATAIRQKCLPLFFEYFHDDWHKADVVLGRCGLIEPVAVDDVAQLAEGVVDLEGHLVPSLPPFWNPVSDSWDAATTRQKLAS